MRHLKYYLLGVISILFFLIPCSAKAQTEEIQSFNVSIEVQKNAQINITETIRYYFPSPKHGIYREIPIIYKDKDGRKFALDLKILKINDEKGESIPYSSSKSGDYLQIKIGEADKTVEGIKKYNFEYTVLGAINYFNDYDELYWNATGDKWKVPIRDVSVEVNLPDQVSLDSLKARCFTGSTGSTQENCQANISNNMMVYSAQDFLTVVAGWNKGVVEVKGKHYIFSGINSGWFFLIPLIVLIIMLYLYQKNGRDPKKITTITPEFSPPQGLSTAQMGTILDEKVHPQDLTSDIISWAVNGIIKIKEDTTVFFKSKDFTLKSKDFTLIKLKDLPAEAKSYEKKFFESIFSDAKEVKLSDLKSRTIFMKNLSETPKNLYTELVADKYFPKNPQKIRNIYLGIGIAVAILGSFLAIPLMSVTLGISAFLSGAMIVIFSFFMPSRTLKGTEIQEKILGFKEFITKVEKYRTQWAEKENIFFDFLPYAVMFGVGTKWAQTFKDIYKEAPDWYEGNWSTFNTIAFISSVNSFSTSWSGISGGAASGGSGFSSGGGFSGGGFGGGGGGSW